MDIHEQSALTQSEAIKDGSLSAAELMAATLDRIDAVNPTVNAIVALRDHDELMAEARAADASRRKGWLHGIPIAIKDLANVKGLRTTRGSPIFADTVATQDDLLVQRLKAEGALIIGKTNTPEFGLGSHTFNPVYGATKNPYDQSKSAGGSSGGAAVALATRMLSVADGSDMMGSLRNPAAWNNVYGFRPSWGVVPAEPSGDVFMHHLSTSGPMARTPADLAALSDTITGPDPRQPLGHFPGVALPRLSEALPRQRLGWLGDWDGALPFEDGLMPLSESAMKQMAALGHLVEPMKAPFDMDAMWQSWVDLRAFAVSAGGHMHYTNETERALLKPAALWEIERGLSLSIMDLHHASSIRSDWYRRVLALFEEVDVLVLPSTQVWPFPVEWTNPKEIAGVAMDTYHRWMQAVIPASLVGLPVVNIPIGFGENGLPAGLQLIGPPNSGGELMQLAQDWHQATDWPGKRPPVLA